MKQHILLYLFCCSLPVAAAAGLEPSNIELQVDCSTTVLLLLVKLLLSGAICYIHLLENLKRGYKFFAGVKHSSLPMGQIVNYIRKNFMGSVTDGSNV
jgi:hypothetical protein